MQRRGPESGQRLAMLDGAIARVALQAIPGEAIGQPTDQGIAGLFGQHAGGRDGQAVAVASHQGALLAAPAPQGQLAIDDHQRGAAGQAGQGPQHRPLRCRADAEPIDLGGAGLTKGPGQGAGLDLRDQHRPLSRTQALAVGEAGPGQWCEGGGGQNHHPGEDGAEQTTATHLIDARTDTRIAPSPGIGQSARVVGDAAGQGSDRGGGATTAAAGFAAIIRLGHNGVRNRRRRVRDGHGLGSPGTAPGDRDVDRDHFSRTG